MAGLDVQIEERGETIIARFNGEASLDTAEDMERGLQGVYAHQPKRVVLDLSGLTFIASLAMGNLVSLHQHVVHRNGGWVKAACLDDNIHGAFKKARLDALFELTDSVEAALG